MRFLHHSHAERGLHMESKDIKKLGRAELIEIIYQLKKSEQELQNEVASLKAALEDRTIRTENLGSVAEASLALSGVFEKAQAAADAYLAEVKRRYSKTDDECAAKLLEATAKAEGIIAEANRQKDAIDQQCRVSRSELRRVTEVLQSLNESFGG